MCSGTRGDSRERTTVMNRNRDEGDLNDGVR